MKLYSYAAMRSRDAKNQNWMPLTFSIDLVECRKKSLFSQEVVHYFVGDAVPSDSLVGHRSRLADAFLSPLCLRSLVLKPLYVVLSLVLKTSLPRMTAVLVGGKVRTVRSTREDSCSETNLPDVWQQEPVVVERSPVRRRDASFWIQPLSIDRRDVSCRTLFEDVVDPQNFVFLKFAPVLNVPQVFHRPIVVARVLAKLRRYRPQITDQLKMSDDEARVQTEREKCPRADLFQTRVVGISPLVSG
jgi:hypothetical protein